MTIRKFITGSAAVLALGLAGGLGAPAVAAAAPAGTMSDVTVCDKYLKAAKSHEAQAQQYLTLAKKAAAAGDAAAAANFKKRAAEAQHAAKVAYDKYKKCRT
ncbi:hypothetical protein [Amycolatopsis sp. 195334CR]|uniref:hypothetical protein n=1 Tax=Amycolatopsis sp. 195334CR TaxID=2814588 RepID=UPI001A8F0231|nr:hypothetical protein [Amycolatopsis sp. 195334CR]MBN6033989.1 hypothetical protein [Amycolatopsis sp. 195334CR]